MYAEPEGSVADRIAIWIAVEGTGIAALAAILQREVFARFRLAESLVDFPIAVVIGSITDLFWQVATAPVARGTAGLLSVAGGDGGSRPCFRATLDQPCSLGTATAGVVFRIAVGALASNILTAETTRTFLGGCEVPQNVPVPTSMQGTVQHAIGIG